MRLIIAGVKAAGTEHDVGVSDLQVVTAELAGLRTQIVSLETQAETRRARLQNYVVERRRRVTEIKKYQVNFSLKKKGVS